MNQREETFAQALFRGLGKRDAAIEAGYAPGSASNMGWKLAKLDRVQHRIAELNDTLRRRNDVAQTRIAVPTREWVLRELVENVIDAKNAKDRSSVNRGLELVGKEIGMFVTRSMQIDSPLSRLPAERLVALLQLIEQAIPGGDMARPVLTIEAAPTDASW